MAGFRDDVAAIFRGEGPPSSFDAGMGFRFLELGDGQAVVECDASERFHNPTEVVHGGLLFGLADSAIAFAISSKLEEGETCTSIEASIRFLRPLQRGTIRAAARVVRAGRTICLAECDILDPEGRVMAKVTSTFLRIRAEGSRWVKAEGRKPGKP